MVTKRKLFSMGLKTDRKKLTRKRMMITRRTSTINVCWIDSQLLQLVSQGTHRTHSYWPTSTISHIFQLAKIQHKITYLSSREVKLVNAVLLLFLMKNGCVKRNTRSNLKNNLSEKKNVTFLKRSVKLRRQRKSDGRKNITEWWSGRTKNAWKKRDVAIWNTKRMNSKDFINKHKRKPLTKFSKSGWNSPFSSREMRP